VFTYRCYDLVIRSDFELRELGADPVEPSTSVDVVIQRGPVGARPATAVELPWGLWRDGDVCGVDIPEVARYEVSRGERIVVDCHPQADERDVRLYLLGTMLGAILMQRGHLVLHGNAIRVGSSVAVVVGRSGAGKSTLAAEFARRGLDLLSDDVVPVDASGNALPGYPRIKLWDDALEALGHDTDAYERITSKHAKFHVPISRGRLDALPLSWVYVLETHDGPELELSEASGVEAFELLHEHTYRRELLADRDASWQHLQQCASVAKRARVVRVHRPALTMTAAATADAILADIDATQAPGQDHLEEALLP
jgi:hypothetical protein